ncbi:MAG: TolB family protein [Bryobacteraceae bacterium]
MKPGVTRRALLSLVPNTLAAGATAVHKPRRAPAAHGEFVRFVDPTTEAWVLRLTALSSASVLPAPQNRFISSKHHFLIFSSDRTGAMTPFHLDLHTGALRPLAETKGLAARSLCLDRRERSVYFVDGGLLKEAALAGRKTRTIAEDVTAFGMSCSGSALLIARRGRLFRWNDSHPIAEDAAFGPLVRPDGTGCLFGREARGGREFWYVPLAPLAKPRLLVSGRIWNPFWSPRGKNLLFLRDVETKTAVLSEIHEANPETGVERKLDPTSEFAAFAPNGNASVFVGASRSKAQPTIILLLRSVARELTLCEHDATHPASVSPVFSPDSRRVFFQSDREGKAALYSIDVEKFVNPT